MLARRRTEMLRAAPRAGVPPKRGGLR